MSMNLLLYVEERTVGNELAGEPAETWTRQEEARFFTVRTISGTEYLRGQRIESTATHALSCHYFAVTNPRMRLTKGENKDKPSRVFNIESVVNRNEENKFLDWIAREVV